MAREMTFDFLRPVFSGESVSVEVTVVSVEIEAVRQWARIEAVCRNDAGKEVLLAHVWGFVSV
jgi:acyl dehydratase